MNFKVLIISILSFLLIPNSNVVAQNAKANGYKGIWFTLGQFSEFGDKYSGGLGTYTANHIPVAIYAPEVQKTFFTYGGTTAKDEKHLLIMVSYFDHKKKEVPKPVIVYDKDGVNDPHDNASISIDGEGYIWIFVSGRGKTRPGLIFKSRNPYTIETFDQVKTGEMTYPQPWWINGKGFLYLFTKYTKGRELYWSASPDGKNWAPDQKLAGMGGHYQVTNMHGNKLVSVFNYHPGGNVDKRTNIYLAQTEDMGKTWTSVDGKALTLPVGEVQSPAMVRDYESEGKLVYLNDVNFDKEGNPVILAVISHDFRPGPKGDPREWTIIHHKNGKWNFRKVCLSTHNYDMGSLWIEKKCWRIVGPTETGPQKFGTGGEMATWESTDEGINWKKVRNITQNSPRNHSYARRPVNAHPDFYAFWADGHADQFSESHLYFTDEKGDKTWVLPYEMKADFEKPELTFSLTGQNKGTGPRDTLNQKAHIEIPVNYQEAQVPEYSLPDLLTISNGQKVTNGNQWTKNRRPELLELFTNQVYGRVPGTPYTKIIKVVKTDPNAMDGAATLKLVDITITAQSKSLTIRLGLFTPNKAVKPVPAFLLICNRDPNNIDFTRTVKSEFWPAEEIIARGYAIAAFDNADVDPDKDDGFKNGIHGLLDTNRTDESWGTLAAWAWGASRCLDYLVTDKAIAPAKIAVVGHSRGAKTALWAGATDQRFAMVVCNEAGCGGSSLSRRRFGETIYQINKTFPHWFCTNYKNYGGNEDALPVDQHMLLALIAPRPLYIASAEKDLWGDPYGQYLALFHAVPAYNLFVNKSLLKKELPPVDSPVISGNVAYHVREGKHNLLLKDWNFFMDFADKTTGMK